MVLVTIIAEIPGILALTWWRTTVNKIYTEYLKLVKKESKNIKPIIVILYLFSQLGGLATIVRIFTLPEIMNPLISLSKHLVGVN